MHPGKGPMGKDGNECPSSCPVKCGFEEVKKLATYNLQTLCQLPTVLPRSVTCSFKASTPNNFVLLYMDLDY